MPKTKQTTAAKSTAKKRSINLVGIRPSAGDGFNQQDPKRRLGNFNSAGEHSRRGGRTTGIVGQRKQKFRTDKKKQ